MTAELARLNAALEVAFGARQVLAERVLQRSGLALVAAARDGGTPVIVKQFLGPAAATAAIRLREAHEGVAPAMATGPFRLAALLRVAPPQGLAVLEQAPGQRVDAVLAQAGVVERSAILHRAGGWLAAFAAPRLRHEAVNLHPFIRRRKEHQPPGLAAPDRALTGEVLAAMRGIARDLAATPLAQSGVHGDLTPFNLHLAPTDSGVEIWGFDLQPPRLRPVAQDAAQFLAVAGLRTPPPPGPLRHGLPAADLDHFLAACPAVADPDLRFFLGDRLLRALHDAGPSAPRAAAALHHWLEGA